jgi:hypothetical protein
MPAARGWYSLIQYCPDPSRAEAANIGVLLFSPERAFIEARTAEGNDRIRRFFGRESFDPHQINVAKKSIEERLRADRDRFRSLDDLQRFIDTRAQDVLITPPRPVRVEDLDRDLDDLFDELVGGRARRTPVNSTLTLLRETFERLQSTKRVFLKPKYTVPVIEREINVPFAYQNGVLNLIRAEPFPDLEKSAIGTALRLAAEGDLIERHSAATGMPAKLIVISVADDAPSRAAIDERLERLFLEFQVRFVRQSRVSEFVRQVEHEVGSHP